MPPKRHTAGFSAGTGKLCVLGNLELVFIWSCFVSLVLPKLADTANPGSCSKDLCPSLQ